MNGPDFEGLLKERMGLDAASIGSNAIARAVRERAASLGFADGIEYWQRVSACEAELQQLIDAVVVPETWFFRDREIYAALIRLVRECWLPAHAGQTLRLLSIPCATGEEPYSIAIALFDAGFALPRIQIDAVDISVRALAHARRAVYGKNAFRDDTLTARAGHFERGPDGVRLVGAAREAVRFIHGNLVDRDFLSGVYPYDLIFCRNVLIYFDRAMQDRAVRTLGRLLATDGYLFVGASETALLADHGYASLRMPGAFAFRKKQPGARASAPTEPPARPREWRTPPALRPSAPAAPRAKAAAGKPVPAAPTPDALATAERLANCGRLAEAAALCESAVRERGPSAQAYYLLGLIHDAHGDSAQAQGLYRKALYVNAGHVASLIHLALILERQGDRDAAQRLRQRARRSEGAA